MADEGLAASRSRQARQVLHAALAQAVSDGLIGRNPTDGVKVATTRPCRQRYLTAEQVAALAVACDERQDDAGTLIRVLAYAGLRWGEAVALRVGRSMYCDAGSRCASQLLKWQGGSCRDRRRTTRAELLWFRRS